MGLLLAHSSCGAYLVGRTQNGHKSFSESINKRDKRERMATCCFLEGLYTFFRGNYLWIKKNPPPKHQCFGFCARLLRAEENICHVPGCPFNWKNTMTGQFPAQPWISFLLWAIITKHNLWKRALFWEKKENQTKKLRNQRAGLQQAWDSTCKAQEMVPVSINSLHHPVNLIYPSSPIPSNTHPWQLLAQPISAEDKAALTWSGPKISLHYNFHFYLL